MLGRAAGALSPTEPAPPPVVEIVAADKVFANGVRGLAPVKLSIAPGEFVSLIGPSGCGKSTLLKLIANLIEPSSGKLLWWRGGFAMVGVAGKRLAFVFQDPTLMPWARVDTNVRLPLDLSGVPRAEAARRVEAALAQVDLTAAARRFPRQLSGGMRMRVSIARALITEPDLLLMDEPFGALDEFTRNKLDEDLVRLAWERRLTNIFVTHSIYEAVFLSTRIVVMAANPGRMFGEFVVNEALPRGDAFRKSDRFALLCRDLSLLLSEASIASRPSLMRALFRRPGLAQILAPVAVGVIILVVWQAACSYFEVPKYLFPTPSDIATSFLEGWPVLLHGLWSTLKVTLLAFAASVILGTLIAFLFVQNRLIELSLMPYAVLLQVTPIVAVVPLIIILVKDTAVALTVCATVIAIFPIISNTTIGLRSIEPGLLAYFRMNKASSMATLWRLRIPSALPFFMAGLRISSGLSLVGAVVAEFVAGTGGTSAGLAYEILQSSFQLDIPRMFAALFLITATGVLLYGLMVWLQQLVLGSWHESAVERER